MMGATNTIGIVPTFDEDAFDVPRSHLQCGWRKPRLRLEERAWQRHHGFMVVLDRRYFILIHWNWN